MQRNVQKKKIEFDGIIIDNTDVYIEGGPANSLFTVEFFKSLHSILKTGGAISQQVSEEKTKAKWIEKVKSAGYNDISFIYSETPEYGTKLPLGIAKK